MLALNMATKQCCASGSADALGQDAVIPLEVVGKLLEDADELGANGLPLGLRVLQTLSGHRTLSFRPSVGPQSSTSCQDTLPHASGPARPALASEYIRPCPDDMRPSRVGSGACMRSCCTPCLLLSESTRFCDACPRFRSAGTCELPGARLQQRHHALRVVDLRDRQVQVLLERVHDALGLLRRQHRRLS